jgi:membrane protease YdiL (CAAX protease family)
MDRNQQFFVAAMVELSLGALAVLLGRFIGANPHAWMPATDDSIGLAIGFGGGLMLGLGMAGVIQWLEHLQWDWIQRISTQAEGSVRKLLHGCNAWHVLSLSLAAGAGEELLFRGWLQESLCSQWSSVGAMGVVASIVISSMVFGIAHPLSLGYVVIASLLGVVLGVAFWCTENLLLVIIAHATYDAVLMLTFVRQMSAEISS